MIPFKVMYGRDPPPVIRGGVTTTTLDEVSFMMKERDEMLDMLKEHLM